MGLSFGRPSGESFVIKDSKKIQNRTYQDSPTGTVVTINQIIDTGNASPRTKATKLNLDVAGRVLLREESVSKEDGEVEVALPRQGFESLDDVACQSARQFYWISV